MNECECCGEPTEELFDCEEEGQLCRECAEPLTVPCCKCGKDTTIDDVYEDLCSSCCRAPSE